MKRTCLSLALLLFAVTTCRADSIPWVYDLALAQKQAIEKQRLVLVHFTASNCAPCRALERSVYSRPEFVRSLLANYVPVKIDAGANPQLAQQLRVQSWPTDIIVTPQGVELYRGTSPQNMNDYIGRIDLVAAQFRTGRLDIAASPSVPNPTVPAGPVDRASQFVPPSAPQNVVNQFVQQNPGMPQQPAPQPPVNNEPPVAPYQPSRQPPSPSEAPVAPYQPSSNVVTNQYVADTPAAAPGPQEASTPQKQPQLALDGFCPVSLVKDKRWQLGNAQWGHIHRGKLYLFANEQAKAEFWKDPDRYSPIMGGFDVVQFIDGNGLRDGSRRFGSYYRNRYYLFATEASLMKFEASPDFYSEKATLAVAENDRALMRR